MANQGNMQLTISQDINRLDEKMMPFDSDYSPGHPRHTCLAIDVTINHAFLLHRTSPLAKRTELDHENGRVLISLPRSIGGYHAKNMLLGDRGLGILTFIAQQADVCDGAICALSPDRYRSALEELLACLDDAESQMEGAMEIQAGELTLRELRLKARSPEGKLLTRFEQLVKHDRAQLIDSDLDMPIEDEAALRLMIEHRIKKACVMGVRIEGMADRLRAIYERCTEGVLLDIDREVERKMPGSTPFRTFTEALGYTCNSFEQVAKASAAEEITLSLDSLSVFESGHGVSITDATPETADLFEAKSNVTVMGRVTREVSMGLHRMIDVAKASMQGVRELSLEDVVDLGRRGLALLKKTRSLTKPAALAAAWISRKASCSSAPAAERDLKQGFSLAVRSRRQPRVDHAAASHALDAPFWHGEMIF